MMSSMISEPLGNTGSNGDMMDITGLFLSEYTAWLWGCGATCARTEKNVSRIAKRYGYDVDITIMPHHVSLSMTDMCTKRRSVFIHRIQSCGINFDINTKLSALSWEISDHCVAQESACVRFKKIISAHYDSRYHILLLTSLANASFCRVFGGDAVAMVVVFAVTMIGFALKQCLTRLHCNHKAVCVLCAFVSASLSTGCHLFGWGDTPDIAIGTSVLYLVPGVLYINAASDLLDGHYICSYSRCVEASILTVCLSLGLCAGIYIMGINIF